MDQADGRLRTGLAADSMLVAIYRTQYRHLVRIAALLLGDNTMAEEIVQDTFVAVHNAPGYLRDPDETMSHLRQTMISNARGQMAALSATPGKAPDRPGIPVMGMLRNLPGRQREAVVLKYYADWPDPQIAAAMGISEQALNAHLQHGMSALRLLAGRNWDGGT
jgi:DNA-directed RNA polymerase specialized sigma24 family protein